MRNLLDEPVQVYFLLSSTFMIRILHFNVFLLNAPVTSLLNGARYAEKENDFEVEISTTTKRSMNCCMIVKDDQFFRKIDQEV